MKYQPGDVLEFEEGLKQPEYILVGEVIEVISDDIAYVKILEVGVRMPMYVKGRNEQICTQCFHIKINLDDTCLIHAINKLESCLKKKI